MAVKYWGGFTWFYVSLGLGGDLSRLITGRTRGICSFACKLSAPVSFRAFLTFWKNLSFVDVSFWELVGGLLLCFIRPRCRSFPGVSAMS